MNPRRFLSEALYEEMGLSGNAFAELVDTVPREISDTVTKSDAIRISSFGRFSPRRKDGRIGRNRKTGEETPFLRRRGTVSRASDGLKRRIDSAPENVGDGQVLEFDASNVA